MGVVNMLKVVKGYRVFDEFCINKSDALEILEGWEHKEKVTTVYAVTGCEINERINLLEERITCFDSYESANDCLISELESYND
jgi:hypothetical protein